MENKFHGPKRLIAILAIFLLSFTAIPVLGVVPAAHASPSSHSTLPGLYFTATTSSPFYRSNTPIVDGPVTETINSNGGVTLSISTRDSYYDAGFYFAVGTLGSLTDLTIAGSGSIYVNLWINPQEWTWTGNSYTSLGTDGAYGAFGPDEGSSSWTITQSSEVGMYTSTGTCTAYGPYTLAELQSVCGLSADTPVALWVGTSSLGTDLSVTVDSINGIPPFIASSNIASDAATCLGWGATYVLSTSTCYITSTAIESSGATFYTNIDILSGGHLWVYAGTFTNRGAITVENSGVGGDVGIYNEYGTIDNRGTITVENSGGWGIINEYGTINNRGTITVEYSGGGIGIINYETFTNRGTIDIESGPSVHTYLGWTTGGSLYNYGTFTNLGTANDYGTITNEHVGAFDNYGTVTIANSGTDCTGSSCTGLINDGEVNNMAGGTITISTSGSAYAGIINSYILSNSGTVIIESGGTEAGILNYYTISNSGTIEVANSDYTTGIYNTNQGPGITNTGAIDISNTDGVGIGNNGALDNFGTITIENSVRTGLNNNGRIYNEAGGTITVSNVGTSIGVNNVGTFDNYGTLNISSGGTFLNYGTFYTTGTVNNSGTFTNKPGSSSNYS